MKIQDFCTRFRKIELRIFTIIELLIVIAIIAILASMLLPALNRAKESARGVLCTGNLRSIGAGIHAYSSDYKDWFVPVLQGTASSPPRNDGWFVKLEPYGIKYSRAISTDKGVFRCPSDIYPLTTDTSKVKGYAYVQYGVNYVLHGYPGTAKSHKVTSVVAASQAMTAGDVFGYSWYYLSNKVTMAFRHGRPESRDALTEFSTSASGTSGKTNLVYVDGHVGSMTYFQFFAQKAQHFPPEDSFVSNESFYCGLRL